jgi:hypothetical protein
MKAETELELLMWLDYQGILTEYVVNRLNHQDLAGLPMEHRQKAEEITAAFYWASSPEGISYWAKFHRHWKKYWNSKQVNRWGE